MPTTAGTKSLEDSYPYNDVNVIKLLKEHNIIILAKSNMSQFSFMSSSSISSYGIVWLLKKIFRLYFKCNK